MKDINPEIQKKLNCEKLKRLFSTTKQERDLKHIKEVRLALNQKLEEVRLNRLLDSLELTYE